MSTSLMMLLTRLPYLLVYVVAAVFCLVYWGRARGAMFALLGIGLMLGGSLISVASSIYVTQSRTGPSPTPMATVGQIITLFGIINMILHAGGVALLVTGVFAGRERPEMRGFEVQPQRGY